ncbi:30S ribosomal protein S19e [Ignicoccus hospitalis]|uniref:Small ribosomal subunit protein eS19 n=1 Tax=Ignicoccus hospitalis (strain KIN4/I / DSM 18386 / JCM 14125) TaxID=453591 RepID=A8A965_IGNH4|nr:30S ribosomal protein S19e [Ignicoccus hospitalis]ABU81467.1 SSU ribosomal protein S19E [Ignicoccus hospitalis KIN4/I]HIH90226.1 30S ribosomal protein S19e [Desulfurococcaceae archaeon]
MITPREVPPERFNQRLAMYLKERFPEIRPPEWAMYAKTGCFKDRPPLDEDWWYYRAASILRKLYLAGRPLGIETFRTIYGGRQRRGVAPPHFRKAGGSHIRKILQQLEKAGLVKKVKGQGRVLTPAGRSVLDHVAYFTFQEIAEEMAELKKYAER